MIIKNLDSSIYIQLCDNIEYDKGEIVDVTYLLPIDSIKGYILFDSKNKFVGFRLTNKQVDDKIVNIDSWTIPEELNDKVITEKTNKTFDIYFAKKNEVYKKKRASFTMDIYKNIITCMEVDLRRNRRSMSLEETVDLLFRMGSRYKNDINKLYENIEKQLIKGGII